MISIDYPVVAYEDARAPPPGGVRVKRQRQFGFSPWLKRKRSALWFLLNNDHAEILQQLHESCRSLYIQLSVTLRLRSFVRVCLKQPR
jgi:hypothetical protein